jgi:hypothetical protein
VCAYLNLFFFYDSLKTSIWDWETIAMIQQWPQHQ